jgi:hypothetical protein
LVNIFSLCLLILCELDYFINSKDQELHNITIFSDSQSALGILALNWKSENYFQSINEIKSQINYLKEQGVVVSFNWTPGHATIKGNEIADQLAKEAAKEAETLEVNTQVFTKQDIRKAARDIVTKKWQVRWDSSNSGRHYYRFHKVLKDKVKKYLPNKRLFGVDEVVKYNLYCNYFCKKNGASVGNCSFQFYFFFFVENNCYRSTGSRIAGTRAICKLNATAELNG